MQFSRVRVRFLWLTGTSIFGVALQTLESRKVILYPGFAMSWSDDAVLVLIDLVRRRPSLYDKSNESFNNEKVKNGVAQELAQIIGSTRPGTVIADVLKKWDELCSEFATYHKKVTTNKKKRIPKPPIFYEKMKFLLGHVDVPVTSPMAEVNVNIENLTNRQKEMKKGTIQRLAVGEENVDEVEIIRTLSSSTVNIGCGRKDVHSPSLSSISRLSDELAVSEQLRGRRGKKRPSSERRINITKPSPERSPSPLVDADDLDKTLPLPEPDPAPVNVNLRRTISIVDYPVQDEDFLYMKYVACRMNKLDEAKKLKFKVKIEKMLFSNFNEDD